MRSLFAVWLPLLAQLFGCLLVIVATQGGGSFVGLGVLALGVMVVPATTLVNWARSRRAGRPLPALLAFNWLLALLFPLAMAVLALLVD